MADLNMFELYKKVAKAFIDRECETEGVRGTIRWLIGDDGDELTVEELLALRFKLEDIFAVKEDIAEAHNS